MSDIDPLIKREMQWMAVGVNDSRDLAPIIIARVRRQRIRNAILAVLGVIAISAGSIATYEFFKSEPVQTIGGVTGLNASTQPEITGLSSDYPVTWEQSVGDVSAISAAGGLGDTLGGLTAVGLKISWERCGREQCPTSWILLSVTRVQQQSCQAAKRSWSSLSQSSTMVYRLLQAPHGNGTGTSHSFANFSHDHD
jgi:hypothetical protein